MTAKDIDSIRVRLGLDASGIKAGVNEANAELKGIKAEQHVTVVVEPKLGAGSQAFRNFQTAAKELKNLKIQTGIEKTGRFSIASLKSEVEGGLATGGGVKIPLKVKLSKAERQALSAEITNALAAHPSEVSFTWKAKEAPKWKGKVLVDWDWGKGPDSGPAGPGGGPGGPGGPSTRRGSGSGRARAATAPAGEDTATREETRAHQARARTARATQETARAQEQAERQKQSAQKTNRTTGATTTTPGSAGETARRAERQATAAETGAARERTSAARASTTRSRKTTATPAPEPPPEPTPAAPTRTRGKKTQPPPEPTAPTAPEPTPPPPPAPAAGGLTGAGVRKHAVVPKTVSKSKPVQPKVTTAAVELDPKIKDPTSGRVVAAEPESQLNVYGERIGIRRQGSDIRGGGKRYRGTSGRPHGFGRAGVEHPVDVALANEYGYSAAEIRERRSARTRAEKEEDAQRRARDELLGKEDKDTKLRLVTQIAGEIADEGFDPFDRESRTDYLRSLTPDQRKHHLKRLRQFMNPATKRSVGGERLNDPEMVWDALGIALGSAMSFARKEPDYVLRKAGARGRKGERVNVGGEVMDTSPSPETREKRPPKPKLTRTLRDPGTGKEVVEKGISPMETALGGKDVRVDNPGWEEALESLRQRFLARRAEVATQARKSKRGVSGFFEWRGHKFVTRKDLVRYIEGYPFERKRVKVDKNAPVIDVEEAYQQALRELQAEARGKHQESIARRALRNPAPRATSGVFPEGVRISNTPPRPLPIATTRPWADIPVSMDESGMPVVIPTARPPRPERPKTAWYKRGAMPPAGYTLPTTGAVGEHRPVDFAQMTISDRANWLQRAGQKPMAATADSVFSTIPEEIPGTPKARLSPTVLAVGRAFRPKVGRGSFEPSGYGPRETLPRVDEAAKIRREYLRLNPEANDRASDAIVRFWMKNGGLSAFAKSYKIKGFAEGGLYSRPIGTSYGGGEGHRNVASLNTAEWKKARAAQIRRQPFCSHCGIGRFEARQVGNPLTADKITSQVAGGDPFDPANLQTLCRSCNSRKSGSSENPPEMWTHARPRIAGHPKVGKTKPADWLPGGPLFGIKTLREGLKRIKGKAEGGEVPAPGLNKTQRASLTVRCPECGAGVGSRCADEALASFAHKGRYVDAQKQGGTGRKGDPLARADGGEVRRSGLRERMAQPGHAPMVTMVGERGPELEVTDPHTGQTDVVPNHQMGTWLKSAGYVEGGTPRIRQHGRFASQEQLRAAGFSIDKPGVMQVAVMNWPPALTAFGMTGSPQQPQAGASVRQAAAAAGAAPGGVGAPPQPQAGGPQPRAGQQGGRAAAGGAAAAGAAAGGAAGGRVPRGGYEKPIIDFATKVEKWNKRLDLSDVAQQIQYAKGMTPARAFTTSIAQISEQVFGRTRIQQQAAEAQAKLSVAQQAGAEYESQRGAQRANIAEARALRAMPTRTTRQQERLDDLLKEEIPVRAQLVKLAKKEATDRADAARKEAKGILQSGDVAKNLAVGFVGLMGATIAMKAAFTAVNVGLDAFTGGVAEATERQLGYVNTAAKMGTELGQAVRQQDGNTRAVVANTLALTGMAEAAAREVAPALEGRAGAIAGNQAFQQRVEQFAAAQQFAAGRPEGLPANFDANLVKSVGGAFNLGVGPGSQMPTAEILQNYLGGLPKLEERVPGGSIFAGEALSVSSDEATAAMNVFKDGLGKLNEQSEAAGFGLKLVAEQGKTASAAADKTAKVFESIGAGQLAGELRRQNVSLNEGNISRYQAAEFLQAQATYAPTPQELIRTLERPLGAQMRAIQREGWIERNQTIPADVAMRFIARPQVPYGARTLANGAPAGNVPTENLLPQMEGSGATFADQSREYQQSYAKYAGQALKSQKAISAEVEKGRDVLKGWGVPDDLIASIGDIGVQIQTVQKGIEQRQLNLTVAEYNNQLRVANRSLKDSKEVVAGIRGETGKTLGFLEGQNIALARQGQLLAFELEQRQINFKLAMAGFTAPGDTPEQRQARIDQAKIEADYAQKQLDIQKQMGSGGYQISTIQASRSVQDLEAQVSLLTQGRSLTIDTKAAQDAITAMNDQQEVLLSKARSYAQEGQKAVALLNQNITDIEARTGKTFNDWRDRLYGTFAAAGAAYGTAIRNVLWGASTRLSNPGPSKEHGATEFNAPGFYGQVGTPTTMTVGEAGPETIAILRNPRTLTMPSGGGGSPVVFNLTINNSGGGSVDDQKLRVWAREVQTMVEQSLNRRTSLLGLRQQ